MSIVVRVQKREKPLALTSWFEFGEQLDVNVCRWKKYHEFTCVAARSTRTRAKRNYKNWETGNIEGEI